MDVCSVDGRLGSACVDDTGRRGVSVAVVRVCCIVVVGCDGVMLERNTIVVKEGASCDEVEEVLD